MSLGYFRAFGASLPQQKKMQIVTALMKQTELEHGQALLQYFPYCLIISRLPSTNAEQLENRLRIFYLLIET